MHIGGFARAKKEGIFDKKLIDTPCPWTYNPKQIYEMGNNNRGYSIKGKATDKGLNKKDETPGPGYYDIDIKYFY